MSFFQKIYILCYSTIAKTEVLKIRFFQRTFLNSYFLYKRYMEDPFFGLAKRYPHFFSDGNIIDIGACVGYNSIIFSQVVSPGYKVYAFEPDRLNCMLLRQTLWHRGAQRRVDVVEAAVGEKDGNVIFLHNPKHIGDGRVLTNTTRESDIDLTSAAQRVQMYSIDSFMESKMHTKNIKFIKIDAEGYELAICLGMQKTLQINPNIIIAIEYGPQDLCQMGYQSERLLDFFRKRGFYRYRIQKNGEIRLAENREELKKLIEKNSYTNLLFTRYKI